jgi:hypothetical protein
MPSWLRSELASSWSWDGVARDEVCMQVITCLRLQAMGLLRLAWQQVAAE